MGTAADLVRCLWYGPLHTATVRVLLVRDTGTDAGVDVLSSVSVARCAGRWAIEVTFAEAREHLGSGQARNRTRHAIEQHTVPFALYCYTITIVWYTLYGHHPSDAADHRRRSPWYTTKAEPSFPRRPARLGHGQRQRHRMTYEKTAG